MKNALINLSICLSDIDKTKIKVHENGKKYLNITIAGKKDGVDQYGNDTYAFISQTKEEKEAQEKKTFLGNGRYVEFKDDVTRTNEMPNYVPSANPADDLPF